MKLRLSLLTVILPALLLSACATPEGIRQDGYLGAVDGKPRYTFKLAKSAWGYRASQNFEAAVSRLSTETCGGAYRELSRRAGKTARSYPMGPLGPAQEHTELHIVIECLG